jgi:hypothetical protein
VSREKKNRIYIIIPRTLHLKHKTVKMSNGRAAAQCCHLGAVIGASNEIWDEQPANMTTIILAVRSSYELQKLLEKFYFNFTSLSLTCQRDTLPDSKEELLHAIAVGPITKRQSKIFENFEKW